MSAYQPKTGARCHCKRGQHRDNCPDCEGTGWRIDFAAIRRRTETLKGQHELCAAYSAHLDKQIHAPKD